MEAFTIDEQFDREPVWSISQFLFAYRNIIEDTIEQGCGVSPQIVFFKGTACGKITIANSINSFLTAHFFEIKLLLTDVPQVHNLLLLIIDHHFSGDHSAGARTAALYVPLPALAS